MAVIKKTNGNRYWLRRTNSYSRQDEMQLADTGYQYGVFSEKLKTQLQNALASPMDATETHIKSMFMAVLFMTARKLH